MKDFIIKKIPLMSAVVLLVFLVGLSSLNKKEDQRHAKASAAIKTEEVRGVWVTYMDLDMSGTDRDYNSFKEKFKHIADTAKKDGFNTLIVHTRPFCDAIYKSKYFPFSHIISGEQGKDASYDALKFAVDYTHRIGLKIEAWVNPYRVRSDPSLTLSKNNPYIKDPSLGVKVGKEIILNPALPKVKELIKNGIRELAENYNIDGVQFDDYFYPPNVRESFDKEQYSRYRQKAKRPLSLKEWRKANVNTLVADCHAILHKNGKTFGISPQGNLDNNEGLYADVKSWCEYSGYVDYICPQLYFSLENPALKFGDALKSWLKLSFSKDVTLYVGLSGYKTGTDLDSGTWQSSDSILKTELKQLRAHGVRGFMLYSYADLEDKRAAKEVSNLIDGIKG